MPNWIQTHIKVNGKKEKVQEIFDTVQSIGQDGKKYFDLNKIFPMPKEIKDTENKVLKINKTLVKKYGANDWYEWSVKNWGTKWNTDHSYFDEEENIISFQTAWSFPSPILEYLAKFEDVAFQIAYADEDRGNNIDVILINNGLITRFDIEKKVNVKKRKELAQMIWNYELDETIEDATTYLQEKKRKRIKKYISD